MNIRLSNLAEFLKTKDNVQTQFVKYFLCGGITFVVDVAVFYAMAWLVLPSLRVDDPFGAIIGLFGWSIKTVSEETLLRNFVANKVVAFLASNTVAYVTNVIFVFRGGRHQRFKEVGLFYLLSTVSFLVFTWVSRVLIKHFDWQVTGAYFFVFLCAMVVNFTMRKKFVFKG